MLTTLHHWSQMDVLDRVGQKVGRVRDVLLDSETGRCDYLLLTTDTGPFTGFGGSENLTPVPLSLLSAGDKSLNLDATRDVIKGAPSFSTSDVAAFTANYRDKLDRFWETGPHARRDESERVAGTGRTDEPYTTRRTSESGDEEPYRRTA